MNSLFNNNPPTLNVQTPNQRPLRLVEPRLPQSTIIINHQLTPLGNVQQGTNAGNIEGPNLELFISLIRQNQTAPDEFVYLLKREENDHYNLKLVDFEIARQESVFYTLSVKGVARYENREPVEFTSLEDWLKERDQYNHLKQLKFCTQFRAVKALQMWKWVTMMNSRQDSSP